MVNSCSGITAKGDECSRSGNYKYEDSYYCLVHYPGDKSELKGRKKRVVRSNGEEIDVTPRPKKKKKKEPKEEEKESTEVDEEKEGIMTRLFNMVTPTVEEDKDIDVTEIWKDVGKDDEETKNKIKTKYDPTKTLITPQGIGLANCNIIFARGVESMVNPYLESKDKPTISGYADGLAEKDTATLLASAYSAFYEENKEEIGFIVNPLSQIMFANLTCMAASVASEKKGPLSKQLNEEPESSSFFPPGYR